MKIIWQVKDKERVIKKGQKMVQKAHKEGTPSRLSQRKDVCGQNDVPD